MTAADTCSVCGGDTRVTETRTDPEGHLRRRRHCTTCAHRFTTYEVRAVRVGFYSATPVADLSNLERVVIAALRDHAAALDGAPEDEVT